MNVAKFRDRGRFAALAPAVARYFAPVEVIAGLRAAERPALGKGWRRAHQSSLRELVQLRAAWLASAQAVVERTNAFDPSFDRFNGSGDDRP